MDIEIPELFKVLAPRWTRKMQIRESCSELEEECVVGGKALNISKYQCCIVGETLNLFGKGYDAGHTDDIEFHKGCGVCYSYSMRFYNHITATEDVEGLEESLEIFCSHIQEEHPEIVDAKKKVYNKIIRQIEKEQEVN